jgi:hypothetical protein
MGRGANKVHASKRGGRRTRVSADARAFINGTAESVSIRAADLKVALGPEHVLARGGSGAHGKVGRARTRAERAHARKSLRSFDNEN